MPLPRLTASTGQLLQNIWAASKGLGQFFHQRDQRPDLIRQLADAGEPAAIPYLFGLLSDKNSEVREATSDCVHRLVAAMPPETLPLLDEEVRRYSDYYWVRPTDDWNRVNPTDVPKLASTAASRSSVLGLASFHRNGHVREAAVRELDRIEDGSELPFLLLRANDWVANIRNSAKAAIQRRMVSNRFEQFVWSVHLVIRLADCSRDKHDEIVDWFMQELVRSENVEILNGIIRGSNRWLSRQCFQRAITLDASLRKRLILTGLHLNDVVLRLQAAREVRHILSAEFEDEILQTMERDQFMSVRREALLLRIERQSEQAGDYLEAALLDRSVSIRELARFYLGKMGRTDFAEFYRKAFPENPRIALSGLSETGTANDVALALPFLNDRSVAMRVAAVRLVGNLGGERFTEELISALQDGSKRVSQTAFKGLESRATELAPNRLVEIARKSLDEHVRLAAIELLDSTGTWSALPFLLRIAAGSDERLATRAEELMARRINRVFTAPNEKDRRQIGQAITEHGGRIAQIFLRDFQKWLEGRR